MGAQSVELDATMSVCMLVSNHAFLLQLELSRLRLLLLPLLQMH